MRVILDTNVLIAGIFSRGTTNTILQYAEQKKFTFCLTPAIVDELNIVLHRPKFKKVLDKRDIPINDIITQFLTLCDFINNDFCPPVVKADPADNKIIGCAILYKADYIVTGDNHLLSLNKPNIPIITPRAFLSILNS